MAQVITISLKRYEQLLKKELIAEYLVNKKNGTWISEAELDLFTYAVNGLADQTVADAAQETKEDDF